MHSRIHLGLEAVSRRLAQTSRVLVLYSGGLDGTYFLHTLQRQLPSIDVYPLIVLLDEQKNIEDVVQTAELFAGRCLVENRVDEFVDNYISRAILANATYDGYPISASLSRPLLAEVAVAVAKEHEISTIVHTSTMFQNSCIRLTNSILNLDFSLHVGIPSFFDMPSRNEKLSLLRSVGWEHRSDTASQDQNIWCREMESIDNNDPESDMDLRDRYYQYFQRSMWVSNLVFQ